MEEQSIVPSDDEDSGNDEPPYSVTDRQDRDEQELVELPEEVSENEQEENEFEIEPIRPEPAQPINVNQFIELLSNPHDNNKSDNNVDALPVEGMY